MYIHGETADAFLGYGQLTGNRNHLLIWNLRVIFIRHLISLYNLARTYYFVRQVFYVLYVCCYILYFVVLYKVTQLITTHILIAIIKGTYEK